MIGVTMSWVIGVVNLLTPSNEAWDHQVQVDVRHPVETLKP